MNIYYEGDDNINQKIWIPLVLVIVIIAAVGGYFGYQEYQSATYNSLLNQSESNFLQAKTSLNQTGEKLSYETNINKIKQSMSYTDQAINETAQMISVAPDNATKKYAEIRNDQFKIAKQVEEMYLRLYEDIKTSGIFGAMSTIQTFKNETESISKKMSDDQNQLISLVNNNPELKQRLTQALGEKRVKELLVPINNTSLK